ARGGSERGIGKGLGARPDRRERIGAVELRPGLDSRRDAADGGNEQHHDHDRQSVLHTSSLLNRQAIVRMLSTSIWRSWRDADASTTKAVPVGDERPPEAKRRRATRSVDRARRASGHWDR